jgi:hypothetical protein
MPAERQRVHLDRRRVGNLYEGDAIGRQRRHWLDRIASDARMETVEYDPEIGAIRHTHDVPSLGPILDVPSPGERFIADAKAMLASAIGEFGKIGGGSRRIVDRFF